MNLTIEFSARMTVAVETTGSLFLCGAKTDADSRLDPCRCWLVPCLSSRLGVSSLSCSTNAATLLPLTQTVDSRPGPRRPDVEFITGRQRTEWGHLGIGGGNPLIPLIRRIEETIYVRRADWIAVRHRHGQVVAVVEIVSPGNKASKHELRTFVEKSATIAAGHPPASDRFVASKRDPQGVHKAIWDELVEEGFEQPADQRLTVAAYDAGPPPVAYVEPIAVGEALPDMPIFLKPDFYLLAPLEETYRTTWNDFFPNPMRKGCWNQAGSEKLRAALKSGWAVTRNQAVYVGSVEVCNEGSPAPGRFWRIAVTVRARIFGERVN